MREAQIKHSTPEPADFHRRFEDVAEDKRDDAVSFFFDLKLMLPAGLPAQDLHRARLKVERRLHRVVRKRDRIVWTADGFFLLLATTDPARAGAAAERIHQDICAVLTGGDTMPKAFRRPPAPSYTAASRVTVGRGERHGSAEME